MGDDGARAVHRSLRGEAWPCAQGLDLHEINEAFSVAAIALQRVLELDPGQVNVNGGAVALGHPIGASGARILVALLHAMQQRDAATGMASLCLGGGNAVSLGVGAPEPPGPPPQHPANPQHEHSLFPRVGVIGAGTMGNGIAQVFAAAGAEVDGRRQSGRRADAPPSRRAWAAS